MRKFQINTQGQNLEDLSDALVVEFGDCDISWCSDGTAVITTEKNIAEIENGLSKVDIVIMPTCRTDIKHRVAADGKEPDAVILEKKGDGTVEETPTKDGVKQPK